jgi:hypothetical protein
MCPSAQVEDLAFQGFGWCANIDSAIEVFDLVSQCFLELSDLSFYIVCVNSEAAADDHIVASKPVFRRSASSEYPCDVWFSKRDTLQGSPVPCLHEA